jgi:hypothetical protein
MMPFSLSFAAVFARNARNRPAKDAEPKDVRPPDGPTGRGDGNGGRKPATAGKAPTRSKARG